MTEYVVRRHTVSNLIPGPYKELDGGWVCVLGVSEARGDALFTRKVVSYIDLSNGDRRFMPLNSDTEGEPAWGDEFSPEDEVWLPRFVFEAVPLPVPPPPPQFQPVDAIRICLQLSTATMDLNPYWQYDVRVRMITILGIIHTPVALSKIPILENASQDVGGEFFTQEDHRAIYLDIANALMTEANIVVA